jgi:hypothetical protein
MKTLWFGLMVLLLVSVSAITGCGKKLTINTVNLEYSFQSASESTQATITEAVEAIEKADYSAALEKLKKVEADPKLTAEQKTAVGGVIGQLEKR